MGKPNRAQEIRGWGRTRKLSRAHKSNQCRAFCGKALRQCLIGGRASVLSWVCRFCSHKVCTTAKAKTPLIIGGADGPAPAVTREAEEGWARWLVASARSSALRMNGTSRIWSNSHFRREAFAVFSLRLIHSTVNDASQSAAAGVDTRPSNFIFDSASQRPSPRVHSAIVSVASAWPTHKGTPSSGPPLGPRMHRPWSAGPKQSRTKRNGDERQEPHKIYAEDLWADRARRSMR